MTLLPLVILLTVWPSLFLVHAGLYLSPYSQQGDKASQQNAQTILNSESRIRHSLARSELSIIDNLSSRLEIIESKLNRLQSTFQHKFDGLTEEVERLATKYEIGQERLNDKLVSVQTKIESGINKLQIKTDENFSKIETKQAQQGVEVKEMRMLVDEVKLTTSNCEEKTNQSMTGLVTNIQEVKNEVWKRGQDLENLTAVMSTGLQERCGGERGSQSDQPNLVQPLSAESVAQVVRTEVMTETHKIGAKMNNMYNDLSRNIRSFEALIKESLTENNKTNKELQDDLRQILGEQQVTEGFFDMIIDGIVTILQPALTETNDKLKELTAYNRQTEANLQSLLASQEVNGETCHQMKGVIENKIALILGKIYDNFINRTDKFSKQITEVAEIIKSHNTQMKLVNGQTKEMVLTLAEESSQDHKQLDSSISEMADKTEDISSSVQDLQDQLEEMNETFTKTQKTLNELSFVMTNNLMKNKIANKSQTVLIDPIEQKNNNLSVIEANYRKGIINIVTNDSNHKLRDDDSKEIVSLNKTVQTGDLVAIIGEAADRGNESTTEAIRSQRGDNEEEVLEAREETDQVQSKSVDITQFLLAYIKLLKGHLSREEFLLEAVPGRIYRSYKEMARELKITGGVPRETVEEIESLDEEGEGEDDDTKEGLGRVIQRLYHQTSEESEEYDDTTNDTTQHD